MKQQKLLLLLFVLPAMALHAQITIGGKVGLNLSGISGNGIKSGVQSGFEGGAFSEISLNKKWGLQPEVFFSLQNNKRGNDFSKYYVEEASTSSNASIQLGYIKVPVLLRYKLNDKFSLNLGPQVGFLVYQSDNLLRYEQKSFKKMDAGIAAGGQFNMGAFRMYLRYYQGLLDVNGIDERYKWHPAQIDLDVGVALFTKGGKTAKKK